MAAKGKMPLANIIVLFPLKLAIKKKQTRILMELALEWDLHGKEN